MAPSWSIAVVASLLLQAGPVPDRPTPPERPPRALPSHGPLGGFGEVVGAEIDGFGGRVATRASWRRLRLEDPTGPNAGVFDPGQDAEVEQARLDLHLAYAMSRTVELGVQVPLQAFDISDVPTESDGSGLTRDSGDIVALGAPRLGAKVALGSRRLRLAPFLEVELPFSYEEEDHDADTLADADPRYLSPAWRHDRASGIGGVAASSRAGPVDLLANVAWFTLADEEAFIWRAALRGRPTETVRVGAWAEGIELEGSVDHEIRVGFTLQVELGPAFLEVSARRIALADGWTDRFHHDDAELVGVSVALGFFLDGPALDAPPERF